MVTKAELYSKGVTSLQQRAVTRAAAEIPRQEQFLEEQKQEVQRQENIRKLFKDYERDPSTWKIEKTPTGYKVINIKGTIENVRGEVRQSRPEYTVMEIEVKGDQAIVTSNELRTPERSYGWSQEPYQTERAVIDLETGQKQVLQRQDAADIDREAARYKAIVEAKKQQKELDKINKDREDNGLEPLDRLPDGTRTKTTSLGQETQKFDPISGTWKTTKLTPTTQPLYEAKGSMGGKYVSPNKEFIQQKGMEYEQRLWEKAAPTFAKQYEQQGYNLMSVGGDTVTEKIIRPETQLYASDEAIDKYGKGYSMASPFTQAGREVFGTGVITEQVKETKVPLSVISKEQPLNLLQRAKMAVTTEKAKTTDILDATYGVPYNAAKMFTIETSKALGRFATSALTFAGKILYLPNYYQGKPYMELDLNTNTYTLKKTEGLKPTVDIGQDKYLKVKDNMARYMIYPTPTIEQQPSTISKDKPLSLMQKVSMAYTTTKVKSPNILRQTMGTGEKLFKDLKSSPLLQDTDVQSGLFLVSLATLPATAATFVWAGASGLSIGKAISEPTPRNIGEAGAMVLLPAVTKGVSKGLEYLPKVRTGFIGQTKTTIIYTPKFGSPAQFGFLSKSGKRAVIFSKGTTTLSTPTSTVPYSLIPATEQAARFVDKGLLPEYKTNVPQALFGDETILGMYRSSRAETMFGTYVEPRDIRISENVPKSEVNKVTYHELQHFLNPSYSEARTRFSTALGKPSGYTFKVSNYQEVPSIFKAPRYLVAEKVLQARPMAAKDRVISYIEITDKPRPTQFTIYGKPKPIPTRSYEPITTMKGQDVIKNILKPEPPIALQRIDVQATRTVEILDIPKTAEENSWFRYITEYKEVGTGVAKVPELNLIRKPFTSYPFKSLEGIQLKQQLETTLPKGENKFIVLEKATNKLSLIPESKITSIGSGFATERKVFIDNREAEGFVVLRKITPESKLQSDFFRLNQPKPYTQFKFTKNKLGVELMTRKDYPLVDKAEQQTIMDFFEKKPRGELTVAEFEQATGKKIDEIFKLPTKKKVVPENKPITLVAKQKPVISTPTTSTFGKAAMPAKKIPQEAMWYNNQPEEIYSPVTLEMLRETIRVEPVYTRRAGGISNIEERFGFNAPATTRQGEVPILKSKDNGLVGGQRSGTIILGKQTARIPPLSITTPVSRLKPITMGLQTPTTELSLKQKPINLVTPIVSTERITTPAIINAMANINESLRITDQTKIQEQLKILDQLNVTKQLNITKQLNRTQQLTNRIIIPEEPITTITRIPEEEPQFLTRTQPKLSKQQAYDVLIKAKQRKLAKGKYKSQGYTKANSKPLTREAALGLGMEITDTYANRSFTIRKSNKQPVEDARLEMLKDRLQQKFRTQKKNPNVLVEKTAHAIDSSEELLKITYEGLKAIKRKKAMASLIQKGRVNKANKPSEFIDLFKRDKKSKKSKWI